MENSPWVSLLEAYDVGGYQVRPLTSRKQLRKEARAMLHCVDQYAGYCRQGNYQVFSIRDKKGLRLATLSLALRDGWWDVDQCYGPENGEVLSYYSDFDTETETMDLPWLTDLYYVASDVENRYNTSTRSSG